MALDFPNAPTNGQTYTGPNGVIWTWDGTKWANGTVAGAYAPVLSPVFTGDPQAPTPSPGDSDTSVATTAFVQAAVATANHNTGRNLLHNPLFNVAQRGAGPWTTTTYMLDRWSSGVVTDTVSFTRGGLNDGNRAQIGDEAATYALTNTFTGNAAAGACNYVSQAIEDVRRLAGKTVTVSFWATAISGTPKLGVNLAQVFGSGGSPSPVLNMTGQSVTISTSFARYSLTFNVPSASGKTLGTNNDHCTALQIWYSSGATNNTIAGSIGVQSGSIFLWGVQLEIGSVATPLEKPDPRYDRSNCERFYWAAYMRSDFYGAAGQNQGIMVTYPTAMRANPTFTFSTVGFTNASGLTPTLVGSNTTCIYVTVGGLTGFSNWSCLVTASADL